MGRRPHEPAELRLLVSRTDAGLVVRTPMTPGWAGHARTPAELARVVEQAFAECAVAAYARLRGTLYDLAALEETIPDEAYAAGSTHPAELADAREEAEALAPTEPDPEDEVSRRRRAKHPRTHPPEQWVELPEGGMLSPKGRRYGETSRQVQQVRAARALVASARQQ